jgi:hypothetical protein
MVTTLAATDSPPPTVHLPRFARGPVLTVVVLTGVLMLLASRNYGYFFDEAYFVVAGHDHLAWGYFDQPALVPALAGLAHHLFPGSLVALRFPATLAVAGGVLLTALIARELGGNRVVQVLSAAVYAMSGASRVGHWLATYSIDPFFWTLIFWALVRWTRQRREGRANDWLLFVAGVATAFSLQTKFLVPALWVAVAAAALVFGPRELLRRPKLWLGAAVAVLATVPNLVWQIANDWPYARMSQVVVKEFPGVGSFLWQGLAGAGLGLGTLLLLAGLVRLVGARELRPYRYLGVATVLVIVATLALEGRVYYLFSLYALPIAAGAVALQRIRWTTALKWTGGVVAAVSLVISLLSLPVYPRAMAERMPHIPLVPTAHEYVVADGQLVPLVQGIAAIYRALPPEQQRHTAILTDSYAFAAGVDLLGPAQGLPRAYSGHRGYYYFGHPSDQYDSVLFCGTPAPAVQNAFTTGVPVAGGFATLYIGRKDSWEHLWPALRAQ